MPEIKTFNPANPSIEVAAYPATEAGDVGAVIDRASAAQREWAAVPGLSRTDALAGFLDRLATRSEDLARSITLEQGKPIAEARGEVAKSIAEARVMAARAGTANGQMMPQARAGVTCHTIRRPRGVIVGITPWNFPILTPMRKIAPALTFGNAMILKPSEFTPGAAMIVAEVANAALPRDLLQVVNGSGDLGAALTGHPGVQAVTFTGSVETGKKIYATAAQNLIEVSLELGGKNPAILHDASDLDAALDQIFGAAMMCSGQRCTAISRVIVQDALAAKVVAGLAARADRMAIGDGMTSGVTMGPLTTADQFAKVCAAVDRAVAQGAHVAAGGSAIENNTGGYFYAPTILDDVTPDMDAAQNEIFGPVISVLRYATFEQALEIANGVEFGLTSALFSETPTVVERFVAQSQSGMLHVNHGTVPDNHMPFVGIKASGVGNGSVGASAENFYTTEHSVYRKASAA